MIVNAVWIDGPLPLLERMCARSWIVHGHEYRLWSYDPDIHVPDGAELIDASEILSGPIHRYTDKKHAGSPIMHANLFRYRLMRDRGGCTIDADTMCLKSFDLSGVLAISSEMTGSGKQHPNLSFVNMPLHSQLAIACCREAESRVSNGQSRWGLFGPKLLSQCIEACVAHDAIREAFEFSPIHWSETGSMFSESPPDLSGSYAVQMWHNTLRFSNRDLNAEYPSSSLWSQWKALYA